MSEEIFDVSTSTYQPGRLEADWLTQSLSGWFEDGTLADILYPVRGGKEANVYCCRGGPDVGGLVAAKVYRPRKLRELSNDAMYREGRGLLDAEGHSRKARDSRLARAVRKGTRKGRAVSHTSWVKHEYAAMCALYDAGGAIPEPIAASDNAVLMAYVGDELAAAPTLERLHLPPETATALLAEALRNIELMLQLGLVHGDLSPYNLLLWEDALFLIDFPQVVDALRNPHAPSLLRRDVTRVCEGFARSGAEIDASETADAIWDRVFGTEGGVPEGPIAHVR